MKASERKNKIIQDFLNEGDRGDTERGKLTPSQKKMTLLLQRISQAVSGHENEPTPNSEIKRRLSHRLQERANFGFWRSFARLLQVRIPVYQAGLATGLLLLCFLGMQRSSDLSDLIRARNAAAPRSELTILDSLRTVEQLRSIEDQKIGRNIKEDSLLVRFIVTSVEIF